MMYGNPSPNSYVGQMIMYGHHKGGMVETLPADRSCEACGAQPGSYEAGKLCIAAEMIHVSVMRREVDTLMSEFGGIKSGKKIRRKITQMYGRDTKRLTEQTVDARLKDFNEKLIRPKPKYCPTWVWKTLRSILLRDTIQV